MSAPGIDNPPLGFASVTPYFVVRDAPAFVHFLVNGLGGLEVGRSLRPDGSIANAQVRMGTATVMVSEASVDFPPMLASYYLYVADAAATLAQALALGAELIMPIGDMPYGDRQGGVRDAFGNYWWISQRIEAGPYRF